MNHLSDNYVDKHRERPIEDIHYDWNAVSERFEEKV